MIYKTKNKLAIFFIIFLGIVLGGLLGEILGSIPGLGFLKTGVELGFSEPFAVNLMILEFSFGVILKVNIMSIVGAWIGYLVQKKIIE